MPFINTKVNVSLSAEEKEILKRKLGEAIGLISGKSERWLMLDFEEGCSLYFQGKNDARIAFVEVQIFGGATDGEYDRLTQALCGIYQETLKISPDKIYIKYEEIDHWGWNGTNF